MAPGALGGCESSVSASWTESWMDLAVLGMAALIFAARVVDVSLGTLRTAFIVRGKRAFAFGVGFVEVLVWVVVVAQVITHLDHPLYVVAFALGFASGTVVGITVEGWVAIGEQVVRVFTTKGEAVAAAVRQEGFAVTTFAGQGRNGSVQLLFIKVPRRRTRTVIAAVRKLDPLCFYTVEDVRLASAAAAQRPVLQVPLPLPTAESGLAPEHNGPGNPTSAAPHSGRKASDDAVIVPVAAPAVSEV